jgi:hypothetical protein
MSVTPFEPKQKEISDYIHREYRNQIYPLIFDVDKGAITYDQLPATFLEAADYTIALDCSLHVKYPQLPSSLTFSVSYRFRDESYQNFQDVTFTEWNEASDIPGELYKGTIEYFTYGYYCGQRLIEVIVIDFHRLKLAFANAQMQYSSGYNRRSGQPFRCVKFCNLKRLGLVFLHLKEIDGQFVSQEVVELW